MVDRIAVLREGRVQQVGAPGELYARPENLFVVGIIGSSRMNLLSGKVVGVAESNVQVRIPGIGSKVMAIPAA